MSLVITEAEGIPQTVSTRTREPNPFDGKFPTAPNKVLNVELPSDTEDEVKYVNKVATQAQAAARQAVDAEHPDGYTARVKREGFTKGSGKSEKQWTRLTIWTVDRIYRAGAGRKSATK